MIVRSLHTTKMNLGNYGLGPRGCIALAVALVVSFLFVSVIVLKMNI
jgi:hypothetical protein